MNQQQAYERDNLAYHLLRAGIAQSYPKGWFVGIADQQIVGAASTFRELQAQLSGKGIDPRSALVVEAGAEYPASSRTVQISSD